jgi:hypothetical protein
VLKVEGEANATNSAGSAAPADDIKYSLVDLVKWSSSVVSGMKGCKNRLFKVLSNTTCKVQMQSSTIRWLQNCFRFRIEEAICCTPSSATRQRKRYFFFSSCVEFLFIMIHGKKKKKKKKKASWVKSFRDAMEKWNASVIQHEEQEQLVTEQLTGLQFNISGTIPVASAFEKPFTVFIIEMTNNSKVDGHKISVTILKRYRQLLVREVEAWLFCF